jgi:hypothetical protein
MEVLYKKLTRSDAKLLTADKKGSLKANLKLISYPKPSFFSSGFL